MRRRSFGRKRSVAWIPGFSCYDDATGVDARTFGFAGPVPGTLHTWGVAVVLCDATDLPLHGGEDAVIERIRGKLYFFNGLVNAGAGLLASSFALRVVVAQHEPNPAGTFNESFVSSNDMQQDRILYEGETWVTADNHTVSNPNFDFDQPHFLEIDVRAKRRVQEDNIIALYFQTVLPAGTTAATMKMSGGLRALVKRPR